MTPSWEYFDGVEYLANGTPIKVVEWRKVFEDGTAIIRMGYLRINNCPRYQVVVLFRNVRVMADKPLFRNFDDALEAADEWLSVRANRAHPPTRRLSAVPSAKALLALPTPRPRRVEYRPPDPKPAKRKPVCYDSPKTAFRKLPASEKGAILKDVYYRLDHGKVSLEDVWDAFCGRIGFDLHLQYVQRMMRDNDIVLRFDKQKALAIVKPKMKREMARIIKKHPTFGLKQCRELIEQGEFAGYRKTIVRLVYEEARREFGIAAKGGYIKPK